MNTNLLLTLLGIFLSITFFLITYRKTIGAKNEKKKKANKDIISTLIKRIVLENSYINFNEINLLVQAKSREYNIRQDELYNIDEILSEIFSKIFENDFINSESRDKIIIKLRDNYGNISDIEENIVDSIKVDKPQRSKSLIEFTLGLISSIVAAVSIFTATEITQIFNKSFSFDNKAILITVFISLLSITIIIILNKIKRSYEPQVKNQIKDGYEFEKHIQNYLNKRKIEFKEIVRGPYDFNVEYKNKHYLIEAKFTINRISHSHIKKIIERIEKEISEIQAEQGYVVTHNPIPLNYKKLETQKVKIINIDEFKKIFS